nr:SDR family oxidoreductase [candidate division Zixibacteria bacterium]
MKKLENKTALITGAGRGIGRATAPLFAGQGADLILVSRTDSELESIAGQCRSLGRNVYHEVFDLAELDRIDSFIDQVRSRFNRVDILINNAARFEAGLMREYPVDKFRLMLETNLVAPFYLAQKIIPLMDPESGGTIVNISSYSGCFGTEKFPGFGAYNISKYGLWGLTEILALENKEKNIRVNQLTLSGVDTDMFRRAVPPGVTADLTPEQVAEKILYLAGDDSHRLTGQNIMLPRMPDGV